METYYFFTYYRNYIRSWAYDSLEDCLSNALDEFELNKEDVAVYSVDVDEAVPIYDVEDIKDATPLYKCEHIITISEETYDNAVKVYERL